MFNSTHYVFMVDEDDNEDVNDAVGSIYVLDPNGDTCQGWHIKNVENIFVGMGWSNIIHNICQ